MGATFRSAPTSGNCQGFEPTEAEGGEQNTGHGNKLWNQYLVWKEIRGTTLNNLCALVLLNGKHKNDIEGSINSENLIILSSESSHCNYCMFYTTYLFHIFIIIVYMLPLLLKVNIL